MQLSILIPAVPERWDVGKKLFMKLKQMCEGKDIEVLLFMDNRKRFCGAKMDALMNISNGKYFMFCHDDDDILTIDEVYRATFQDVDVITFKQKCINRTKERTPYIVTFGLGNENELKSSATPVPHYIDCRRPPYHVCAWNRKFKTIPYNCDMYAAEDWDWVQRALPHATTEVFLDVIVCTYDCPPELPASEPTPPPQPQRRMYPFIRRE